MSTSGKCIACANVYAIAAFACAFVAAPFYVLRFGRENFTRIRGNLGFRGDGRVNVVASLAHIWSLPAHWPLRAIVGGILTATFSVTAADIADMDLLDARLVFGRGVG